MNTDEKYSKNKQAILQYVITLAAGVSAAASIVCLHKVNDIAAEQEEIKQKLEQIDKSTPLDLLEDIDADANLNVAGKKEAALIASSERKCLEEVLFFEIRNGDTEAMHNVADVVLNRTKAQNFPSTVCGVVKQPQQFSYRASYSPSEGWQHRVLSRGGEDAKALLKVKQVVKQKIKHGANNTNILWYTTHKTRTSWMKNLKVVSKDSWHKFFAKA